MKYIAVFYALALSKLLSGTDFCRRHSPEELPCLLNLTETHRKVWAFEETDDSHDLYCCDQALNRLNHPHWNPLGTDEEQARLLEILGPQPHTSMSIGDVVVIKDYKDRTQAWVCDLSEWTRLPILPGGWGDAKAPDEPGPSA